MTVSKLIARQLREVYFGKNWTWSYLQQHLEDVTWKEATRKLDAFNTIAVLTYHIAYYVKTASAFLDSGVVEGSDKLSFKVPPIESEEDWQQLLRATYTDVETFAQKIAQLPDERLFEVFGEEKYGNYYRNLAGIVEHAHYHLGQIVILKKLVRK